MLTLHKVFLRKNVSEVKVIVFSFHLLLIAFLSFPCFFFFLSFSSYLLAFNDDDEFLEKYVNRSQLFDECHMDLKVLLKQLACATVFVNKNDGMTVSAFLENVYWTFSNNVQTIPYLYKSSEFTPDWNIASAVFQKRMRFTFF